MGMDTCLENNRQWVVAILEPYDYLEFRVYLQSYFLLLYLEYANKQCEDCIQLVCLLFSFNVTTIRDFIFQLFMLSLNVIYDHWRSQREICVGEIVKYANMKGPNKKSIKALHFFSLIHTFFNGRGPMPPPRELYLQHGSTSSYTCL